MSGLLNDAFLFVEGTVAAFDGSGNYSLGIKEQTVFPEIDYNKIDKIRGLQVNIVTTAKTDQEAFKLLELVGLPFSREN